MSVAEDARPGDWEQSNEFISVLAPRSRDSGWSIPIHTHAHRRRVLAALAVCRDADGRRRDYRRRLPGSSRIPVTPSHHPKWVKGIRGRGEPPSTRTHGVRPGGDVRSSLIPSNASKQPAAHARKDVCVVCAVRYENTHTHTHQITMVRIGEYDPTWHLRVWCPQLSVFFLITRTVYRFRTRAHALTGFFLTGL